MSAIIRRFSSAADAEHLADVEERALPKMVHTGAPVARSAASWGSSSAEVPARRVEPKAAIAADRPLDVARALEDLGVLRVRARPPELDERDPEARRAAARCASCRRPRGSCPRAACRRAASCRRRVPWERRLRGAWLHSARCPRLRSSRYPSSSTPWTRHSLAKGSISKRDRRLPPTRASVCAGRSTASAPWRRRGAPRRAARGRPASTATGSRPFFIAFCLKMSANDGATMARRPQPTSAQGACSRDEPQPKLAPATRICAPGRVGSVEREVEVGRAVGPAAPVGEDAVAEAALVGHLEEPRRDDLVGVDVVDGKHDVDRRQAW